MKVTVKGMEWSFCRSFEDLWAQQNRLSARKQRYPAADGVLDRKWSGCSGGREVLVNKNIQVIDSVVLNWCWIAASNYSPHLQSSSSSLRIMKREHFFMYARIKHSILLKITILSSERHGQVECVFAASLRRRAVGFSGELVLVVQWFAAEITSEASVEEWTQSLSVSYQRIEREVGRLIQVLQCWGCSTDLLW